MITLHKSSHQRPKITPQINSLFLGPQFKLCFLKKSRRAQDLVLERCLGKSDARTYEMCPPWNQRPSSLANAIYALIPAWLNTEIFLILFGNLGSNEEGRDYEWGHTLGSDALCNPMGRMCFRWVSFAVFLSTSHTHLDVSNSLIHSPNSPF